MKIQDPNPPSSVGPSVLCVGEAVPPEGVGLGSSLPKPYYQDNAVTLYHGDCREIIPLLGRFDAVITDPPYQETSLKWDRWVNGWPGMLVDRADQLWCFGSMRMFWDRRSEFNDWKLAQDLVWEKQNGSGLSADRFRRVHELSLHFYRGEWGNLRHETPRTAGTPRRNAPLRRSGKPQHFGGTEQGAGYDYTDERLQRSVIFAKNSHSNSLHPTEKPVSVVRDLITYSVPAGGVLLDPFSGSGTSGRAAKDTGRRAVLIEGEERFCEISALRMSQEVLAL